MQTTTPRLQWINYFNWLKDLKLFPDDCAKHSNPPLPHTIKSDTRTIKNGDWFIALKGQNFDGHDFIDMAFSLGAQGVIANHDYGQKITPQKGRIVMLVPDTMIALGEIARGWRQCFPMLKSAALTGSVGKTTAKEMLRSIFGCQLHPYLVTEGNHNNEIGVPQTLFQLHEGHKLAVFELGARKPGDIGYLMNIVNPAVTCLLNVGMAHLGVFGSKENLVKAKWQIVDHLASTGIALINGDQTDLKELAKTAQCKINTFGYQCHNDICISNVTWLKTGMNISLKVFGQNRELILKESHAAYPYNVAAAVGIALALGLDFTTIKDGLEQFSPAQGRFNTMGNDHLTLIDDAYNANPDSMRMGLETLNRLYPNEDRLTLILGDMLELGDDAPKEHFLIGQWIAVHLKPYQIISVGEYAAEYSRGFCTSGNKPEKMSHYKTVDDLLKNLTNFDNHGIIYLKASRGINLQKLIPQLLK